MQIGECPYCDYLDMWPMPQNTPCAGKYICEGCKKEIWLWHSRINPMAYTKEDFEREFIIDEASKTVKKREPLHAAG